MYNVLKTFIYLQEVVEVVINLVIKMAKLLSIIFVSLIYYTYIDAAAATYLPNLLSFFCHLFDNF